MFCLTVSSIEVVDMNKETKELLSEKGRKYNRKECGKKMSNMDNLNPFRLGGFRLSESLGGGHPAPPMIFAQKMILGKNF